MYQLESAMLLEEPFLAVSASCTEIHNTAHHTRSMRAKVETCAEQSCTPVSNDITLSGELSKEPSRPRKMEDAGYKP